MGGDSARPVPIEKPCGLNGTRKSGASRDTPFRGLGDTHPSPGSEGAGQDACWNCEIEWHAAEPF